MFFLHFYLLNDEQNLELELGSSTLIVGWTVLMQDAF